MKLTDNEKKYWFNIVTPEAVESILKRRAENDQLSSAYDTAQAFNPSGKVPRYVIDRVSSILWSLYASGKIKKIRQDVTSNPDSAHKKWHYKYSPTPRKDWLSLVPRRTRKKTFGIGRGKGKRSKAFLIEHLAYYKELMDYAKQRDVFSFIQAFRAITRHKESTSEMKNPEIYRQYQRLYNTAKYLTVHGYLKKLSDGKGGLISFKLTDKAIKKTHKAQPLAKIFSTPKTRVTPIEPIEVKKVSVEVEVLNSNISDKTKIALLKKLMGDG